MKRFLIGFLSFLILFSFVSCAPQLTETEDWFLPGETRPSDSVAEAEPLPTGEIVIPEGFSAGFGKVKMNPTFLPCKTYDGNEVVSVKETVYATCVAISDGNNTVLLFSIDTLNVPETIVDLARGVIHRQLDIPEENIWFTATHNHATPSLGRSTGGNAKYKTVFYNAIKEAGERALRDLAPATAFTGKTETEGLTYVRRYYLKDGSFWGIHMGSSPAGSAFDRHETEADETLLTIRFDRRDKKDIVMMNWQCHAADGGNQIHGDFVGTLRKKAEEAGMHFAYYQGAAGNLVRSSRLPSDTPSADYADLGKKLFPYLEKALANETKVNTGTIRLLSSDVTVSYKKVSKERIQQAKDIQALGVTTSQGIAKMEQYGFLSRHEVANIAAFADIKETETAIGLSVISFGEIAFAAAPYEMFDTNGMEVKSASPFPTTFLCAYTNGAYGYIPSRGAFPNGGYEVYSCKFEQGTGELLSGELVRMLKETEKIS